MNKSGSNKSKCSEISNTDDDDVVNIQKIKAGSKIEIDSFSRLGRGASDIRDSLRCLYSKKISLHVEECIFDFNPKNKSYACAIELLNHIVTKQKESIKAGMDKAIMGGKKIGRTSLKKENLPEEFVEAYQEYKCGIINKVELAKKCKCSRPTLNTWINCYEDRR